MSKASVGRGVHKSTPRPNHSSHELSPPSLPLLGIVPLTKTNRRRRISRRLPGSSSSCAHHHVRQRRPQPRQDPLRQLLHAARLPGLHRAHLLGHLPAAPDTRQRGVRRALQSHRLQRLLLLVLLRRRRRGVLPRFREPDPLQPQQARQHLLRHSGRGAPVPRRRPEPRRDRDRGCVPRRVLPAPEVRAGGEDRVRREGRRLPRRRRRRETAGGRGEGRREAGPGAQRRRAGEVRVREHQDPAEADGLVRFQHPGAVDARRHGRFFLRRPVLGQVPVMNWVEFAC